MKAASVPSSPAIRDRASGMLHVRVTDELKEQAAATLAEIGLTTSDAIRLFLHRVVVEQRLPLDLRVPNAETQAALREAREIAKKPGRFTSPQALFDALEKAG